MQINSVAELTFKFTNQPIFLRHTPFNGGKAATLMTKNMLGP